MNNALSTCLTIKDTHEEIVKLLQSSGISQMEYYLYLAGKELDHLRVMFDCISEDGKEEIDYKSKILCLLSAFTKEYKTDGYCEISFFDICKGLSMYIEKRSMSGNDFYQDNIMVGQMYHDLINLPKSDFFVKYNEILYSM